MNSIAGSIPRPIAPNHGRRERNQPPADESTAAIDYDYAVHERAIHPAKPTIGITMGDPAGIGPEVVIKALSDRAVRSSARFVIYGLNEILTYAADRQEIDPFWFRVQHDSDRTARQISEDVVVLDFDEFDGLVRSPHHPSKAGGLASKAFVE